jgi:7,8-dihydroneopterin aldolase/epimerase/oxygenase
MTTRVGLEAYAVIACHGAFDFEHEKEQPFIISIWATLGSDVLDDDLGKTLNYADLQQAIDHVVVDSAPVRLMETLCDQLIRSLKENKLISVIEVRIEKPDAPLPHPGGLAVVERTWTRH